MSMQLQNRERIAYYAALSMFFGSVELFIPKLLPFFKLGLANIPILLSLDLSPLQFLLLLLLKGIGNSYISGNIFSYFALISIAQSVISGIVMYCAKRVLRKSVSNYGISLLGALSSTYVQIFLTSLILGSFVYSFLPPMLVISLASAVIVAYFANTLRLPEKAPQVNSSYEKNSNSYVGMIALVISAVAIMSINSLIFSLFAFISALIFQKICKRKIMILPYALIILFMLISSLFTPSGLVIFNIGQIRVTKNALEVNLTKAFMLSATVALSQSYSQILTPSSGLIVDIMLYFTSLLSSFKSNGEKNLFKRVRGVLTLSELSVTTRKRIRINSITLISFSIIFVTFAILSYIS